MIQLCYSFQQILTSHQPCITSFVQGSVQTLSLRNANYHGIRKNHRRLDSIIRGHTHKPQIARQECWERVTIPMRQLSIKSVMFMHLEKEVSMKHSSDHKANKKYSE